jgi:hypothetical protein
VCVSSDGKSLDIAAFDKALQDADSFPLKLSDFYVLTTAPDDVKLQQYALSLSQQREVVGKCPVHIWGWGSIEQIIAECPNTQNNYYPTSRRSSLRHLVPFQSAVAIAFITVIAAYSFYAQSQHKQADASTVQLDQFIEATNRLKASCGECMRGFESSSFVFTYDMKKYCTVPIGEQLTVLQKLYDKLATSLPTRPLPV